MSLSSWDKRIDRAGVLIEAYPAASELLNFYRNIARLQRSVFDDLNQASQTDVGSLARHFPQLLALVKRIGPPELASRAEKLSDQPFRWDELVAAVWDAAPAQEEDGLDDGETFFARALLQPFAEYLATRGQAAHANGAHESHCPFCGRKPGLGVLRGEGDGAKRSLICTLCATEWVFRRILCPGCGEEHRDKLPVYTAAGFEHVRVEACDECRTYIKSIDLTKNGLAVPVVDELASVPLDIWAEEHGYTKLQPNLLGM